MESVPTTEAIRTAVASTYSAETFDRWLATYALEIQERMIGRLRSLLSEMQQDDARRVRNGG